jgi:diacylglycerol kinase family enzyme
MGELTVRSADEQPLPLQVDGDYIGDVLEARYSVLPRELSVVS